MLELSTAQLILQFGFLIVFDQVWLVRRDVSLRHSAVELNFSRLVPFEVKTAPSLLACFLELFAVQVLCMLSDNSIVVLVLYVLAHDSHGFFLKNFLHSLADVEVLDSLAGLTKSVLDDASEFECVDVKFFVDSVLVLVHDSFAVLYHRGAVIVRKFVIALRFTLSVPPWLKKNLSVVATFLLFLDREHHLFQLDVADRSIKVRPDLPRVTFDDAFEVSQSLFDESEFKHEHSVVEPTRQVVRSLQKSFLKTLKSGGKFARHGLLGGFLEVEVGVLSLRAHGDSGAWEDSESDSDRIKRF